MNNEVQKIISLIEDRMEFILRSNSLFLALREREPKKNELAQYITDTHFLITFTQPNLKKALNASIAIYNTKLSYYFLEKIFEEIGHEKWAEEDLKNNNISNRSDNHSPTKSMQSLVSFLSKMASESPLNYSAYVLVAEETVAKFGDRVLQLFRASKNGNNTLSVIDKHINLDIAHSESDKNKLTEIFTDLNRQELDGVIATVNESLNLINSAFEEIYEQSLNSTYTKDYTTL